MSLFGTPIAQSVGASEVAQRAQSRDAAKRTPQSGGRTRTIADTVEILIDSPEAPEKPGGPQDDLKDRSSRKKGKRKAAEEGAEPEGGEGRARLDVQG